MMLDRNPKNGFVKGKSPSCLYFVINEFLTISFCWGESVGGNLSTSEKRRSAMCGGAINAGFTGWLKVAREAIVNRALDILIEAVRASGSQAWGFPKASFTARLALITRGSTVLHDLSPVVPVGLEGFNILAVVASSSCRKGNYKGQ